MSRKKSTSVLVVTTPLAASRLDDGFVFGDETSAEKARAEAVERFVNTGDPRAATEQYVGALIDELSADRGGWFRRPTPPSEQVKRAVTGTGELFARAEDTLKQKNRMLEQVMKHSTTEQRFEIQRAEHAAKLAELQLLRAQHEAAARRIAEGHHQHQDEASEVLAAGERLRALSLQLDDLSIVAFDLKEELANERRRAAELAEQLRQAEQRQEEEKQSAERRRAEELAEEQHRTEIGKQKLEQALFEARIRGAAEPVAARQRRAERRADKAARMVQEATSILSEVARRAERDIAAAEKKYGPDSEIAEQVKNHWDAKLRELSTSEAES